MQKTQEVCGSLWLSVSFLSLLSPTLHSLSLSPRSFVHHYVIMKTTGLQTATPATVQMKVNGREGGRGREDAWFETLLNYRELDSFSLSLCGGKKFGEREECSYREKKNWRKRSLHGREWEEKMVLFRLLSWRFDAVNGWGETRPSFTHFSPHSLQCNRLLCDSSYFTSLSLSVVLSSSAQFWQPVQVSHS